MPSSAGEVEIEIGSGKGSFLVAAAERRPEIYLLGVEAGPAYAEYCADRAKRQGLDTLSSGRRADGSGFSYFNTASDVGVTLLVRQSPPSE